MSCSGGALASVPGASVVLPMHDPFFPLVVVVAQRLLLAVPNASGDHLLRLFASPVGVMSSRMAVKRPNSRGTPNAALINSTPGRCPFGYSVSVWRTDHSGLAPVCFPSEEDG